jgi:hypothetical protein
MLKLDSHSRVNIMNTSHENIECIDSLFALFVEFHPPGICPLEVQGYLVLTFLIKEKSQLCELDNMMQTVFCHVVFMQS